MDKGFLNLRLIRVDTEEGRTEVSQILRESDSVMFTPLNY